MVLSKLMGTLSMMQQQYQHSDGVEHLEQLTHTTSSHFNVFMKIYRRWWRNVWALYFKTVNRFTATAWCSKPDLDSVPWLESNQRYVRAVRGKHCYISWQQLGLKLQFKLRTSLVWGDSVNHRGEEDRNESKPGDHWFITFWYLTPGLT